MNEIFSGVLGVSSMYFQPYVIWADTGNRVGVVVDIAEEADLEATRGVPEWQTDWTSEYLVNLTVEKVARELLMAN